MPDWLASVALGQVAAVVAAVAAAWAALRSLQRTLEPARQFLSDWTGEDARPGVPARPGVMERMARTEDMQAQILKSVGPNGGGSMHDAVYRTEKALASLTDTVTALSATLDEHVGRHVDAGKRGCLLYGGTGHPVTPEVKP